jgi:uncharacterized membrane protein YqjE
MAKEIINETEPPLARLPSLLEKLYDSLAAYFEAKLALFRKEVWEEGESLLKRALSLVVAVLIIWAGFLVVTAGLVMALNEWLNNPVLSALLVGALYIVGGIVLAKFGLKNLRTPLPRTQAELEKDKQWIKANT